MDIPSELNDEIINYCKLNNIGDINNFKIKLLKQGFTIEKFGYHPPINLLNSKEERQEKKEEKVINKNVELPKETKKNTDIYGENIN